MNVWDYYTPEQQEKMTTNRGKFSPQELKKIRQEADELISKLCVEVEKRTPSHNAEVVQIAKRIQELAANFDEGDPEINKATDRFYDENPDAVQHGMNAEVFKYYLKCLS